MIKIAVTNKKGGVSKTTTALNLSAGLAKLGHRVLMVDLDSQGSLTDSVEYEQPAESLADYIQNPETGFRHYTKIASQVVYGEDPAYEGRLWIAPGFDDWTLVEKRIGNLEDWQDIFKKRLHIIEDFDFVVFDCPPSLGALTVNALVWSDFYLVPVLPEPYSLKGVTDLIDKVGKLGVFNKKLKCAGVFLTKFNRSTNKILHKNVFELLEEALGDLLMKTSIRENIALSEAITQSEDVFAYSPTSNGAQDYMALTKEVLERINGKK